MSTFPAQLPHGPLTEVLPDLFVVQGQVRPTFGGRQLQTSRTMTVVRDGTTLTLFNTLRLDAEGLAALDALGTVRHLVKLGAFHGRDDAFYQDRYDAELWAFPGTPHERGLHTTQTLHPQQPGPVPDGSAHPVTSSATAEGLYLLQRHGGVLITCDALHNWTDPDPFFDTASAELWRKLGFFGPARLGPGWIQQGQPDANELATWKQLRFKHLFSAHGPPLLHDAHAAVATTVQA